MSYILDALRRSQAERDRGQVPGLNAQPTPADTALRPPRGRTGVWLGSALAMLVLAGVLLWWMRHERPVPGAATAGLPAANVPAAGMATAPNSASAPAAALGTTAPAPVTVVAATTAPAPAPLPIVVSAPPVPAAVLSQPGVRASSSTAMPVPTPNAQAPLPTSPAAATAATAATADARPVPLAQLTPDQRRDLPALAVSGSIWSESAASRFVILNGSVTREGETVAPGLTLERIGRKAAVLRWRDIRIELPL